MLLQCKPVGDSERKCLPVARKNQSKKPGNILGCGVEELSPMGSPCVGPTHCVTIPTASRINLTRFIHNRMDAVKLQLVRQYQRLPLDDFPKTVIRDYDGEKEGMIRKPRERIKDE
jgi:hypothetical protein